MTKFKEYYQKMIKDNQTLFEEFRLLHDKYALDPDKLQTKFNDLGKKVQEVAHEWEDRLCKQSEKSSYSKFSPKLAEKFQDEIRKNFPMIDHIGIIVEKPKNFTFTKINLN